MTIERVSLVDQIEISRNNCTNVRIAKLLVEDGKEISSAWHRTVLTADSDILGTMQGVNEHLLELGEAPVSDGDIERVRQFEELRRTLSA